jgi:transposase-like protein
MESIETEVMDDPSKRDTRGRRIVKAEERERLIREYASSGLTQKAFCKREGISVHTFVSWLGKRKGPG